MTRRRAKKPNAVRLLKQRYELLMGAINEGVYDWNVVDDTIYYSASVKQVAGLPPRMLKTVADWRNRIHPEDLPHYDAAFVDLFKGRTKRFECDYRFRAFDGSWRWARQHGVAVRARNGRVRRVVGATGDITELKDTEQALKQSEERYALATRAATEGIYEWNVETGALFISDRAREVFGLGSGALKNADWTARIHPDDAAHYRAAIIEHFKSRSPGVECEYRVRDAAGHYRWVLDRGQAVRRADGRAIRLIGAEADITQRKEALAEQTATAEILKVTTSSPTDVQPVFEAILANALRLCEATFAAVFTFDGELLRNVAHLNASPDFARFLGSGGVRPSRETTTRRCALERRTIHTADLMNDPEFSPPEAQRREKVRTSLSVPMFRENALVGVISLWRAEVRPFTDKQIALVETFAAQAAIAIENVRLFNETREALEQQKAIAEVLGVVTQSQTDVQPVLQAIARNAARMCGALFSCVYRFDGELIHLVATHNLPPGAMEVGRTLYPMRPDRSQLSGRAVLARSVQRLEDAAQDAEYAGHVAAAGGWRRLLAVPMLREAEPLGVIAIGWRDPGSIAERQVELLKTFADQAVIAIEKVQLFNETREALEQQTATSEILRVISSSPTDTQPVFDAIVQSGVKLFSEAAISVALPDGDRVRAAAVAESDPARAAAWRGRFPFPLTREYMHGVAILDRKVVDVADVQDAPPEMAAGSRNFLASGYRAITIMPMMHADEAIGALSVVRLAPGPLSGKQLGVLKTFADQAVIAIENVRLFNETKEALEQQTAISEVLRVISRSPGDIIPMLDAVAQRAVKLCESGEAGIFLLEGDRFRFVAGCETGETFTRGETVPLTRGSVLGRAMIDRQVVHIVDLASAPVEEFALAREYQKRFGHRTLVAVPLMREDRAIGVIGLWRFEVRAFSDNHIALVRTFADQAAIAIENVRLFNETREALEQQTAISEILQVISGSPTDVRPVLSAVAERAARLCEAEFVTVFMAEDGLLRAAGYSSAAASQPFPDGKDAVPFDRSYISGRAAVTGQTVHLEDVVPLLESEFAGARENQEKFGFRTILAVPLLRNKKAIGVIAASRRVVRRFSDKQVALVETFADQAVIAIENVRLFNETKEALEQQTASGEVLHAISSSIADTAPVFDKILESCQRLFAGTIVGLNLVRDDGMLHIGAYQGAHRGEFERIFPIPLTLESGSGLAILEQRVVHYPDATRDEVPERTRRGCKAIGVGSVIFAPVLWEGRGLGAIFVGRDGASSFSDKEIALLRTFTDQAAIAIENARLFREIQEKSRQLEIASRHKSEFLANMSHELRTPLNAIIGFTRIVMRRSKEALEAQQYENLEKILASGQNLLALINQVLDLSKVEAGRVEVQASQVELAPVLDQCLRTIEPLVKVALVKELDAGLPAMYVDEEKLRQIVINLLSNAAKFTEHGTIRLRAHAANGSVAISVDDTGAGIAADKLELIFEAFEQGDAGGHGGTGLGLTIARRLARLMGGDIAVQSTPGTGSRFTLTLPLRYPA